MSQMTISRKKLMKLYAKDRREHEPWPKPMKTSDRRKAKSKNECRTFKHNINKFSDLSYE